MKWLPLSVILHTSMLLLGLRLAIYAMLPWFHNPWLVLPVELLHGVTYAAAWGAGIVHCKRLAPPELNTTMQVGRQSTAEQDLVPCLICRASHS
jgi:hypothetical protein